MTKAIAGDRPSPLRRAAAAIALVALVAALLYLASSAVSHWFVLLVSVVSLGVAVMAAWYILTRRGLARAVAAALAVLALLVFAVVVIANEGLIVLGVGLGLAAVSIGAASYALNPATAAAAIERAPRARHPVLLMNPKSGGGKAEQFKLDDLCRERGIEPVVLHPGDDLRQLAEGAVARGADLLGMAGGDGSQALVASVASRHGIPFVVIPAGTRNHFALDLGLDRADVPGALDAYEDGVDTKVDLAEVNGRVFVNNASMGVYAKIVQSTDYRDAKMQTAAAMLPDLLGPEAEPLDLRFTLPSARRPRQPSSCLCPTTRTNLRSCAAEGRASASTAACWGSPLSGSTRGPMPRSSLRWNWRVMLGASRAGTNGRSPSSRCAQPDRWRSASMGRPSPSNHRYVS